MARPYLPDKAREHIISHLQKWLRVCDTDDLQELLDLIGYDGADDPGPLSPEAMRASWHAWLDTRSDAEIVQFQHDMIMGEVARDAHKFMSDAHAQTMPDISDEDDTNDPNITPSA